MSFSCFYLNRHISFNYYMTISKSYIDSGNSHMKFYFYIFLCNEFLRSGRIEEAKKILNTQMERTGFYWNQASSQVQDLYSISDCASD